MRKLAWFVAAVALLSWSLAKDKKPKPWTSWSEKEAQKIPDDSPWGQTQTETDVSEMTFVPTTGRDAGRAAQGALNQAIPMNVRIRLLSAKPIR